MDVVVVNERVCWIGDGCEWYVEQHGLGKDCIMPGEEALASRRVIRMMTEAVNKHVKNMPVPFPTRADFDYWGGLEIGDEPMSGLDRWAKVGTGWPTPDYVDTVPCFLHQGIPRVGWIVACLTKYRSNPAYPVPDYKSCHLNMEQQVKMSREWTIVPLEVYS